MRERSRQGLAPQSCSQGYSLGGRSAGGGTAGLPRRSLAWLQHRWNDLHAAVGLLVRQAQPQREARSGGASASPDSSRRRSQRPQKA